MRDEVLLMNSFCGRRFFLDEELEEHSPTREIAFCCNFGGGYQNFELKQKELRNKQYRIKNPSYSFDV